MTTVGSFAVVVVVLVVLAFVPSDPPSWVFGLPSLVPLGALPVLWEPKRRVANAWWHLFLGALFLGLLGAALGAFWAAGVSAVTLLGMALAPRPRRSRGRRA